MSSVYNSEHAFILVISIFLSIKKSMLCDKLPHVQDACL